MIIVTILLAIIAIILLAAFFPDFLVWFLQALACLAVLSGVLLYIFVFKSP